MLDGRKEKILKALVEEYIDTAQPVGSGVIARRSGVGVSSATIRNEMADLEAMGFVEQPHPSAGRMPSGRGYRYYVDRLMTVDELAGSVMACIRGLYDDRSVPVQTLFRRTAGVLSEMTEYTALVEGPQLERATFKRLELFEVNGNRLLLVLLTGDGLIQTRLLERPPHISAEYREAMVTSLNSRLAGRPLGAVAARDLELVRREFPRALALIESIRSTIEPSDAADSEGLFLGGAANMLKQPEFQRLEKIEGILSFLERGRILRDLLADVALAPIDISVTIGEENRYPEMRDCSLVTAAYHAGGHTVGHIGILGPCRMRYSHVVGLIAAVKELLGRELLRRRLA
jgi:heat-inducible transcriptional repressor